jgi:Ni/Co efflux regulator RcnB
MLASSQDRPIAFPFIRASLEEHDMQKVLSSILALALVTTLGAAALAQPGREAPHGATHGAAPPRGEPHEGPRGYQRVTEPHGWDARPASVDRGAYQHNYQAARSYHIGPYRRPPGWTAHRWGYGEILPRAYWTPQYLIADYWLFALEVPPTGYEWVRDGNDALLIDVNSGEILQVEYGVFA